MGGISAFRKIQTGKEATEGTAVAATARLLGELSIEDRTIIKRPDNERRASLAKYHRQYLAQKSVGLSFEGDLTFEQLLYLLHMGMDTVTPTGAGPYVWTFGKALAAAPTPKSLTMEFGDDEGVFEVNGVLAEQVRLSMAYADSWKMAADLFGWTLGDSTFTAAISDPSVESAPANLTKLYIDAAGAGIGGTEVAGALISANVVIPGFYPKFRGGNYYPYGHGIERTAVELELVVEFTSSIETEIDSNIYAGTKRFIELECLLDANHKLEIQGCFTHDPVSIFGEDKGDDTVGLKLTSMYDSTWAKEFQIIVTNSVATLP